MGEGGGRGREERAAGTPAKLGLVRKTVALHVRMQWEKKEGYRFNLG